MRFSTISLLFASLVTASDVIQLKEADFDAYRAKHELVLAEFYAPWCGHCKALAPEYEEAASALKNLDSHIPLVKVDCTEEVNLCQKWGVEGYPTLKIFRNDTDEPTAYKGPRKAPGIIEYMKRQALPAVSVLKPSAIEEFKTSDKVVVVAYYDTDDKKFADTFMALAQALRETYKFGVVHDKETADAENVEQPAVVLYKSYDGGRNVYDGKLAIEDLKAFVDASARPLVGEVGPETYQGYVESGLPLAYIFLETDEERVQYVKEFHDIALKYKGVINFATINATAFGAHAPNLNLKEGIWPAFAIQKPSANEKYPFPQDSEFSTAAITALVEKFVAGKLEPSIKSEPIPESQDGPVTVIVAHNYKEIVMDKDKDVLVEFYAPWCGHCKALSPKYDELGLLFKPLARQVVIAKVDATANDVPEEIKGFPTIKLYPAKRKNESVTFTGERSVEALAKFITENGDHKAEPPEEGEAAKKEQEVPKTVDNEKALKSDPVQDADEEGVDSGVEGVDDEHDEL